MPGEIVFREDQVNELFEALGNLGIMIPATANDAESILAAIARTPGASGDEDDELDLDGPAPDAGGPGILMSDGRAALPAANHGDQFLRRLLKRIGRDQGARR